MMSGAVTERRGTLDEIKGAAVQGARKVELKKKTVTEEIDVMGPSALIVLSPWIVE